MTRRRPSLAIAASLASITVLAACGGGGDEASASAAELEGEPIVLSVISAGEGPTYQPELFSAAEAAAEAVNRAGGIEDPDGGEARPLQILACEASTAQNVNAAVACAREAVDAEVIAAVSKYVSSDPVVEAFAAAGIPLIGTVAQTSQDFTNELSFPLAGSSPMLAAGAGAALQDAGAETVAIVTADLPSGRVLPDFMRPVLADPGDLVDSVFLPVDSSADLTSFFSQIASSDPDGVAILTSTDLTTRTVIGLRQAGYEGRISALGVAVSEESLAQMGEAGEGLMITSDWEAPTSDTDEIARFVEELSAWDEASGEETPRTAFAVNAWASVHFVADQLATLDSIDPAALAASLEGIEVDLGLAPAFTFGQPNFLQLPRLPRGTVQVQEVRDGQVVAVDVGEFLDLNELAQ